MPYQTTKGRAEDTSAPPTVVVNKKFGRLVFSRAAIREIGMVGKFVKLYYEPTRKIIGWRIRDKVEQTEMKAWKLCKPNKTTGTWTMGIKKMLDEFNGSLTRESYPALPVQKYREMDKLHEHTGEIFYFVEVKPQDDTTS